MITRRSKPSLDSSTRLSVPLASWPVITKSTADVVSTADAVPAAPGPTKAALAAGAITNLRTHKVSVVNLAFVAHHNVGCSDT